MTVMPRKVSMTGSALALATLVLTGCDTLDDSSSATSTGSPTSQAAARPTPTKTASSIPDDVCALLTKEEAGALLQEKIDTVRAENSATEKSCFYDENDLNIVLSPTTTADFESEAEHSTEPVSGVGDAAYAGGTALFVLHGSTRITITSAGGTERRVAIARKVITRLDAGSDSPSPGETPTR